MSDINVTAGGPLIQNKLRFFGSFRDWRVHQNVPVQNSQTVLDQTNITSGLGNVTWQINPEQPAHRLLLAPALQQAEPAAEQRVDHRHRLDQR